MQVGHRKCKYVLSGSGQNVAGGLGNQVIHQVTCDQLQLPCALLNFGRTASHSDSPALSSTSIEVAASLPTRRFPPFSDSHRVLMQISRSHKRKLPMVPGTFGWSGRLLRVWDCIICVRQPAVYKLEHQAQFLVPN